MLIIGAKGFAKEVLEVLLQKNEIEELYFYDDISQDIPEKLHGFPILKNFSEVQDLFKYNNKFTIGN
jgi:FlaA1/EpsC-like NDP-sugar epimerase